MRFLTRITAGKSEAARLGIHDSYQWHRRMWEAFPGMPDAERRFLFRVDDMRESFMVMLLSEHGPEPAGWGRWETKRIRPGFLGHDRYRFQLRANPTMRRNEDRRRLGLYREDLLRGWMERKAGMNGFSIIDTSLQISAPVDEAFAKKTEAGEFRRGKHVSVEFTGLLTVSDRTAFENAFKTGIGTAKAFGFGLLMLQPF